MADEQVDKAILEQVDQIANKRLGDSWNLALGGHARDGGIKPQKFQEYLRDPDPIGSLYHDGKQELLHRLPSAIKASTNDPAAIQAAKQAEVEYSKIRQQEREEWRKMKGRG